MTRSQPTRADGHIENKDSGLQRVYKDSKENRMKEGKWQRRKRGRGGREAKGVAGMGNSSIDVMIELK